MHSKAKGLSGKEGSGTGIGDEKDLAYFQDAFRTYKRKPEDLKIKNSLLAELEKLSNVDNRETSRLAALCRARILYDYYICKKDVKRLSRQRADAAGRLNKMLKETPRSLSAACLLASWYKKGAAGMVDSWSVALKGIENIRKDCALKEDLDAADWEDPADEAINSTDSKEKFENFNDVGTKEERLKCLAGYFDRLARKVKDKAESCPMILHKQVGSQHNEWCSSCWGLQLNGSVHGSNDCNCANSSKEGVFAEGVCFPSMSASALVYIPAACR